MNRPDSKIMISGLMRGCYIFYMTTEYFLFEETPEFTLVDPVRIDNDKYEENTKTSAAPTSPQRTTTEYLPPTDIGPLQTVSLFQPMITASSTAPYNANDSGSATTNAAYNATASGTATTNAAYTAATTAAFNATTSGTATTNAAYNATASRTATTNATASDTATTYAAFNATASGTATTNAAYNATASRAATTNATASGIATTDAAFNATASRIATTNATASGTTTANAAFNASASGTATTNAAFNVAVSETATTYDRVYVTVSSNESHISTSPKITTGTSSSSPYHPGVNTTTIAGGVAGGLGLLIIVLLVKVYLRQRKIIKDRDILMMSMYLTPRQTSRQKHSAGNDEVNTGDEAAEEERNSYMEPLVHRQIWQLLDMSPVLRRRSDEERNEQKTMYSSLRISENTAERLQYIARCLGPKEAVLKKHSVASTTLHTYSDVDYAHVQVPRDRKAGLDHGERWSTDTNHYEFVEGSKVEETAEEDTVIYDDVILEQTERLRYTKPPKAAYNFNTRIVRSRSTEMLSAECGCSHQNRLTTAPRHSTVDIRASVIDNVKPFTYKLVGEMKLVTNEG